MTKFIVPALTALALSATAPQAATLTVDYQEPGSIFGNNGWFSAVTIDSEIYDGTFHAGQFELTSDPIGDFLAFCVEITQAIVEGDDAYEITLGMFDAVVMDNIDRLYSSAYDMVIDGLTAAAFQVALWEIVEDSGLGLDLATGTFSAIDANTNGGSVLGTAQGFLDGLTTAPTGLFDLQFFASPTSQDVVSASRIDSPAAVPVPASGLLLLSAAGLMMTRRNRRS